MPKVWKIADTQSEDLVEQLLLNRGIKSKEDRERFFNPKLEYFEKDLNIPGIPAAQKRIEKAIENGEQIIVYGDYDVDGVCASAIIYKALSSLGAKILPYIPHREKEGYGLSKQGLDSCRDSGATLVITVDHGIVAFDQAKYAKEIGLDLIITDHHMKREDSIASLQNDKSGGRNVPEADVVVHSTLICGTGVAWCLIRKMIKPNLANELLELVALATICDMMSLQGVNRSFVFWGLKQLNKTTNVGLIALLNECQISLGDIDAYCLGHALGPRLNAIGRLEHAIDALRLLCTKDASKARKLAALLTDANLKRQELTTLAVEQARAMVVKDSGIHIVHSEEWIPGIIGLIAGRITDEYKRPSIAISVGEVHSKGSARSIDGINIVETIRECSDLLVDVGGHKGAAGFTIETTKIEEFKLRLSQVLAEKVVVEDPTLEVEAVVDSKRLSKSLVKELEAFEPTGFGNPKPVLATLKMKASDTRSLSGGKHLKFKADDVDAIAFGMGDLEPLVRSAGYVDVAYNLEINHFNGRDILQLKVKDVRF